MQRTLHGTPTLPLPGAKLTLSALICSPSQRLCVFVALRDMAQVVQWCWADECTR